ncbi:MAG: amidase family protein [Minwuia sp.]|uniref:amidase family protein n=1 Tax=Minwuia sp. TaxID=2493630 RepID=UPI003A836809
MADRAERFTIDDHLAARALWEPRLDAWAHLEGPNVLRAPGAVADGPLGGVPFGVKDIIDVRGQPTRFGSAAFADAPPAESDSDVVAALRGAGAVPVGKTRTTEFAFVDPTTTVNPYNPAHSPGGSSSGSGAAVGAGEVPFALGTQTAGSLCRPAAYCGAYAYKPGLGVLPRTGVAPLSPSFDAVGVIAKTAAWLTRVFSVLAQAFEIPSAAGPSPGASLRIGVLLPPEQSPEPAMLAALETVRHVFSGRGHEVRDIGTPVSFGRLIREHRAVMVHEMNEHLAPRLRGREERLQPRFRAGLSEGAAQAPERAQEAAGWLAEARTRFWADVGDVDLILACPVPGAAPAGFATTGDQSYLTPWTALGGPLVSFPATLDGAGMPLALLLAAAPGRDRYLVREATGLSAHVPRIPDPEPPSR